MGKRKYDEQDDEVLLLSATPGPDAVDLGIFDIKKKHKKFKHKKDKHKKKHKVEEGAEAVLDRSANFTDTISYAYITDEDDHCETPQEAYSDIDFLLEHIASSCGKTKASLIIYDPYHCTGAVVQRLSALGYTDVYNKNEDFYKAIADKRIPNYDVLVTNPPYSGDNMERLLRFVLSTSKPALLLVPNYLYTKDYFATMTRGLSSQPVFVVPNKRYLYSTPYGRRQAKSSKYTSPFPTFWFCFLHKHLATFKLQIQNSSPSRSCKIALSTNQIPMEARPDNDSQKKKMRNAEKRKKHKARRQKVQQST